MRKTLVASLFPGRTSVLAAFAGFSLAAFASAQCPTEWQSMGIDSPVDDSVNASCMWDPDGAGPAAPRVVVAGSFGVIGQGLAKRIASFDEANNEWLPFGSGITGGGGGAGVKAVAGLPNGHLIAAGLFSHAGGVAMPNIAEWNGTSWQPLGTGIPGYVGSLCVLPNGDVVAGGEFTSAGGVAVNNVARWDGTSWSAMGNGVTRTSGTATVRALAVLANGDVVAGGYFTHASGVPASNIARWQGSAWVSMGGVNGHVHALLHTSSGQLFAGGGFSGQCREWDGNLWQPHSSPPGYVVYSLSELANGDIVAGYSNTNGHGQRLSRFDGAVWTDFGSGPTLGDVYTAIETLGGTLFAGGDFLQVGTDPILNLAAWDGSAWNPPSGQLSVVALIHSMTTADNGDLIAAGRFTSIGGVDANYIARHDGTMWHQLGNGTSDYIHEVVELPNGDIAVVGSFTAAGGVPAPRIARWDGSAWHHIAGNPVTYPVDMIVRASGELVVCGSNGVAGWDGSTWTNYGPAKSVDAITELSNGDLVVSGWWSSFGVPAERLARWDGSSWHAMGDGLDKPPKVFLPMPDGTLIAGGNFTASGASPIEEVARFDGTTWTSISPNVNSTVHTLDRLPNGDILAGGFFWQIGTEYIKGIVRWDGTDWNPVGTGLLQGSGHGSAYATTVMANGDIAVAGYFGAASGVVAGGLALLSSTCPAGFVEVAPGCVGGGTLTADSLPWCGASVEVVASGLPANSLTVAVLGLGAANVPLSTVLPQGIAGCALNVTPDELRLLVPAGGAASTGLSVPYDPALAGVNVYEQFVSLEYALGQMTAVRSSNSLQLTVGLF